MLRHLLLALMIVLLPVRGWVGDAMAGQMLAQQIAASQSIAISPDSARTGGHSGHEMAMEALAPPCPDHAAADGASPADPQHATGKGCAGCTSCDVCHTVALAPPDFLTLPDAPPGAPAPTRTWRPASADTRLLDKPPIG